MHKIKKEVIWAAVGMMICFCLGIGLCFGMNRMSAASDRTVPSGEGSKEMTEEAAEPRSEEMTEEAASGAVSEDSPAEDSVQSEEAAAVKVPEEIVQTSDSLYTYEQMLEDLDTMAQCFPDKIKVQSLGDTADGRRIMEAVLGEETASRHLLIQASIHGREYMNTQVAMRQLEEFLRNYRTGSYGGRTYEELLCGLCLHVIPMANPDGVTISQMGLQGVQTEECRQLLLQCEEMDQAEGREMTGYWENWKANARGVDLNRNFDAGWTEFQGSGHPSSEMYKGEFPASEAETQAILKIAQDYPVAACIAYHSSGNLVYWDYGSQDEIYERDRLLAQTVEAVTGYPACSTVSDGTDSAGCSDYFVLKLGIPAVTIENGSGVCPLGIEEFPVIMEKNRNLLPACLLLYQDGGDR